ncbi:predicted protein [Aspergillus terreus NIH2624]|uniref:Kievitone hydratase n=1 Tax=Aspergillus terreus (strain NIH 2624 / FGSC A1156) TaxID=341663 RepID=Q0CDJ7_ASPTN|nr:uncharacterized protein ATEG_08237 [Aspergillus terreus NIH2624]EAU31410.1 predicted protein [Aspergillus terreus NIH2624]
MSAWKLVMALVPYMALAATSLYRPENISFDSNLDKLPTLFNLTASLTAAQEPTSDSFWTSTFATDTNGHTYFVITHMIGSRTVITRSAFLDLETHVYSQIQNISHNVTTYNPTTGFLDAHPTGFYIAALNDGEKLSGLHVESNVPVTLDPAKSISWFDRQWGPSLQPVNTATTPTSGSWHWIQLHIQGSPLDVPLSGWVVDYKDRPPVQFATIREAPGIQRYLPVASLVPGGRTWTSPYTNITYDLNYTLTLQDGSVFHLEVVADDQEMHSTNGASPVYEGYLDFHGIYKGARISGYGLVEIVTGFTVS